MSADEIKTFALVEGMEYPLLKQYILECSKNLPTILLTLIFSEKEMGHALRFLGLNPTEPQIREMIIEQNTPKGKLNYKQFVDSLESVRPCWKQNMLVNFLLQISVWPLKWLPNTRTLLCLDSL